MCVDFIKKRIAMINIFIAKTFFPRGENDPAGEMAEIFAESRSLIIVILQAKF
jgi:hypothetical protein